MMIKTKNFAPFLVFSAYFISVYIGFALNYNSPRIWANDSQNLFLLYKNQILFTQVIFYMTVFGSYLIHQLVTKQKPTVAHDQNCENKLNVYAIITGGLGSALLMIWCLRNGISIGDYSRFWEIRRQVGVVEISLANSLFWVCCASMMLIRKHSRYHTLIILLFLTLPLALGLRNFVLVPIFLLSIQRFFNAQRKSQITIACVMVLLIVTSFAIGTFRNAKDTKDTSNYLDEICSELNSSNIAMARSIHLENHYGIESDAAKHYFNGLLVSIPKGSSFFSIESEFTPFNTLLIKYFNKWKYKYGQTEGGSIVAESLYYLGYPGLMLVAMSFGVMLSWCSNTSGSTAEISIIKYMLIFLLTWGMRNSLIDILKPLITATSFLLILNGSYWLIGQMACRLTPSKNEFTN